MSLNDTQVKNVETLLINVLHHKFETYVPESSHMPFHTRLLGKDRLALYSFIQSLSTTFGTSIFEPVALEIAKNRFKDAQKQVKSGTQISSGAQNEIQIIMDSLSSAESKPNKINEIAQIKSVCRNGEMKTVKKTNIDLYLESKEGDIYYIDIKSAKPNKGEWNGFKRTLLEWVGVALAANPDTKIHTLVCIPYNPYEPKPYERWTLSGMLDLNEELLVGKDFWDFLGGAGTYEDLLDCFERVGIEMRDEIDENFKKYSL